MPLPPLGNLRSAHHRLTGQPHEDLQDRLFRWKLVVHVDKSGVLSFCNARQMTAPEAYIRFSPEVFPGEGECLDESTTAFLTSYMSEFREHVIRVLTVLPRQPDMAA
jgi:hypothetical protein